MLHLVAICFFAVLLTISVTMLFALLLSARDRIEGAVRGGSPSVEPARLYPSRVRIVSITRDRSLTLRLREAA